MKSDYEMITFVIDRNKKKVKSYTRETTISFTIPSIDSIQNVKIKTPKKHQSHITTIIFKIYNREYHINYFDYEEKISRVTEYCKIKSPEKIIVEFDRPVSKRKIKLYIKGFYLSK